MFIVLWLPPVSEMARVVTDNCHCAGWRFAGGAKEMAWLHIEHTAVLLVEHSDARGCLH